PECQIHGRTGWQPGSAANSDGFAADGRRGLPTVRGTSLTVAADWSRHLTPLPTERKDEHIGYARRGAMPPGRALRRFLMRQRAGGVLTAAAVLAIGVATPATSFAGSSMPATASAGRHLRLERDRRGHLGRRHHEAAGRGHLVHG